MYVILTNQDGTETTYKDVAAVVYEFPNHVRLCRDNNGEDPVSDEVVEIGRNSFVYKRLTVVPKHV